MELEVTSADTAPGVNPLPEAVHAMVVEHPTGTEGFVDPIDAVDFVGPTDAVVTSAALSNPPGPLALLASSGAQGEDESRLTIYGPALGTPESGVMVPSPHGENKVMVLGTSDPEALSLVRTRPERDADERED